MIGLENNSKIIYLYRHGETNWNVEDRIIGQSDEENLEFTNLGYKQIDEIAQKLNANDVQVIYCSDYKRAFKTAEIANSKIKLPIFYQKELRGLNMGKYHGSVLSECSEEKELINAFRDYSLPIGGGESINHLNARVVNFILEMCEDNDYSRIAIITHSAVISNLRAFLAHEKYVSLNECTLIYKNKQLSVIDYVYNVEKYANSNEGKIK